MTHARLADFARNWKHGVEVDTAIIRETSGSNITEYEVDIEDGHVLETVSYSTRPAQVYYTHPRNPEQARPYVRRRNERIFLDDFQRTGNPHDRAGTIRYSFACCTTIFSAYLLLDEYDGETARIAFSYC